MINFIPVFPLNIVVYPGEQLNLHIFEPRYKQLIQDCVADQKPFGIITVIDNLVTDLGTLVSVSEIAKEYSDGKMDIKTVADKVFTVLELVKSIPDKLYSGAIVNYPNNLLQTSNNQMPQLLQDIRSLHQFLNVQKTFKKPDSALLSYDVAHHAGLTLQEEYELLGLFREDQRQEYLKRHLKKTLPTIQNMQQLKEKIQLNGHFKELKGFNL